MFRKTFKLYFLFAFRKTRLILHIHSSILEIFWVTCQDLWQGWEETRMDLIFWEPMACLAQTPTEKLDLGGQWEKGAGIMKEVTL